ncbi:hypothetical protein EON64_09425 [archaeon]|nr:MAG: hypothetical protein EON64_09425 [archaeon]
MQGNGIGASSLKALMQIDLYLILLKCFDDSRLAHYEEAVDPLRDLVALEQEMLLMDLYRVEAALGEVELSLAYFPATELLTQQHESLLKLWEFLAGAPRPSPLPPSKKKGAKGLSTLRVRIPERCTGLPLRLGTWDSAQRELIQFLRLLTSKEAILLANISSVDFVRARTLPCVAAIQQFLGERRDLLQLLPVSVELEQRLRDQELGGTLTHYLALHPTHLSAVPGLVREALRTLQLLRWYSVSDRRIRTLVVRRNTTVAEAANQIDVHIARCDDMCMCTYRCIYVYIDIPIVCVYVLYDSTKEWYVYV